MQPLFKDGFSGMMSVLVMIPFLFVGFDVIPQVAAEINAPKKIIGKILIISIVSAVVFYLLIVFGVTMGLSKRACNDFFGDRGCNGQSAREPAVRHGACPRRSRRYHYELERIYHRREPHSVCDVGKGMVPKWFGFIHPKYKTPTNAILFLGRWRFCTAARAPGSCLDR